MAGEIVGAIAARRIALAGDGVGRALLAAVGECLRHPLSVLGRFWIPTLVLGLVVVASAAASAAAWSATADALADGGDPLRILVSVVALVVVFTVGLVLAGRRLRLARRHLDHRGGRPRRDVRGIHRPPVG